MLRRRRTTALVLLLTLLLAGGGYATAAAVAPLPELRAELDAEPERRIAADDASVESAIGAQSGPAAVGWAHEDATRANADEVGTGTDEVWANSDETREMASITKLVTALVGLDAAPVAPDEDGPSYTVSAADAQIREDVLRFDGVVADTPIGAQLTTRQLLELVLLPSANNYAISYARWVFGDDAAFAEAAAEWIEAQGFSGMRVVEPSGLAAENAATPGDLVRLARLVLADPLLAEIVAERRAEIPGIGTIENTNPLLGEKGVVGVKTGTTASAGYNLLAARRTAKGGRELTAIAVVLGRADDEARASDARALLRESVRSVERLTAVEEDDRLGTVRTWEGDEVGLLADADAELVLAPGEEALLRVAVEPPGAGPAGAAAGEISFEAPGAPAPVGIRTDSEIVEPDLWWRLTNPAILFG
nr:hypothetical protein [Leucobacter weissii]